MEYVGEARGVGTQQRDPRRAKPDSADLEPETNGSESGRLGDEALDGSRAKKAPRAANEVGGTITAVLIGYLKDHCHSELGGILSAAGETRPLTQLEDIAGWSTYDQVRRLFEATASALGSVEALRTIGEAAFDQVFIAPEIGEAMRSLGSPAAFLADPGLSSVLFPVMEQTTEEIGRDEWWMSSRFAPGYEPFPERCAFVLGLSSCIPKLFGFSHVNAVEETCQCRGDPWCRVRLSWHPEEMVDRATQAAYDRRSFEARLSSLQRTVSELVSGEGIESVLPRIIHAAGRAVQARAYVLSIDLPTARESSLYWQGTDEATAHQYVADLNDDQETPRPHVLITDINSAQARYGRLIAFRHPGEDFNASERSLLETYASLAAAALNAATALDDARREATTNRSLFELSSSLVELGTVSDIAQRLADAVPSVIGCDRSIVTIHEHSGMSGPCIAVSGYDPETEVIALGAVQERAGRVRQREGALVWHDPSDPSSSLAEVAGATRSALAVTFHMYVGDDFIGSITADVIDRPERLRNIPDLAERLQGLAGYAAVGLRNARLLEELRHQSLHDSLTGLPNRTLILDRIEQMLARDRRNHTGAGLFFVDLDSFKEVNDAFGHDAGDELLKAVSARFVEALRETDTVGRLGGDEFVVLAEGVSLAAGPELVAQRLIDVLAEPFAIRVRERAHEVRISASIGIVVGPYEDPIDLLRDGDIALYKAKAGGKSRFAVFEPQMHAAVRDHHQLDADLRRAIGTDQFFLVYQPIFELETMRVTGVEALLRWRHPTRGIVGPDEFIAVLEESDLILDIGRWVLNEACQQARSWHEAGHQITVSVNVSGRGLRDRRLVEDVRTALSTSGLDPSSLIVEFTETTLMADTEIAISQLEILRDLGIGLAIDDFGTGYSSLSYLSRFPVDSIKIDQSFVAEMTTTPEAEALVHTLVHLGKILNLRMVAEGIEDTEQLAMLQVEGCDSGQGFLFARPVPPDQVERYFSRPSPQSAQR